MDIKQIYEKMIAEGVNYTELAAKIEEPKLTVAALSARIKTFCKLNNLEFPKVKRGRKKIESTYKIKE